MLRPRRVCRCKLLARATHGLGHCTSSERSIVGYSLLLRPNGLHHLHLHRSSRNIFQEALCVLRSVCQGQSWYYFELEEIEMRDACPLDELEFFLMVKIDNSVPGASDLGATLARGTLLP